VHVIHILADPAVHQAAKYTWTAQDKQTVVEAGFVGGAVIVAGLLFNLVRGGKKAAPASK
jgi:hypothetical protein